MKNLDVSNDDTYQHAKLTSSPPKWIYFSGKTFLNSPYNLSMKV